MVMMPWSRSGKLQTISLTVHQHRDHLDSEFARGDKIKEEGVVGAQIGFQNNIDDKLYVDNR